MFDSGQGKRFCSFLWRPYRPLSHPNSYLTGVGRRGLGEVKRPRRETSKMTIPPRPACIYSVHNDISLMKQQFDLTLRCKAACPED